MQDYRIVGIVRSVQAQISNQWALAYMVIDTVDGDVVVIQHALSPEMTMGLYEVGEMPYLNRVIDIIGTEAAYNFSCHPAYAMHHLPSNMQQVGDWEGESQGVFYYQDGNEWKPTFAVTFSAGDSVVVVYGPTQD